MNSEASKIVGQEWSERLEQMIQALQIAGASVSIYKSGETQTYCAGFARKQADRKARETTRFQIGSITKVFTATLIMRLTETGKIRLDAPVSTYMPDLKIDSRPVPDSLTVRSLLDYSAGFEGDYFEDFGDGDDALEKYVDTCSELRWMFEPGTMRGYNSTAYCIAARLIEIVTGKPFEQALTSQLLTPLGIGNFEYWDKNASPDQSAVGHFINPETGEFEEPEIKSLPHCMCAAGATLTMDSEGLLRLGILHLQETDSNVLSSASINELSNPSKIVPPLDNELMLGWARVSSNQGKILVASGQTVHQNSFLVSMPQKQFAMSILTNSEAGGQQLLMTLGAEILAAECDTVLEFPSMPEAEVNDETRTFTEEDASRFIGTYTNRTLFKIYADGEQLRINMSSKSTTNDDLDEMDAGLIKVDNERLGVSFDGTDAVQMLLTFCFTDDEPGQASHLTTGGRLFARIDTA